MIRKNRLLNFKDVIIYQNDDWFKFSLDSVLLVNFVTIRFSDKKILDLCSGNAPIPMLLTYKTNAKIYGIELQKEIFDLGIKSIKENNMEDQIFLINDNIKYIDKLFCCQNFDIVICNPPYFKLEKNSIINDNVIKSIARHELEVDLDSILNAASYSLKTGGTFAMVHRAERLVEIFDCMRKYKIEPKKLQFIYPKETSFCNLIMVEGRMNGKCGLKILPPLVISNDDGSYNEEIRKYYQDN